MKLFQKNESKETVKLPMSGKVKKLSLLLRNRCDNGFGGRHLYDCLCSRRPSYRSQ